MYSPSFSFLPTGNLRAPQAFAAVVTQAAASNTSGFAVSSPDVRAMVSLAYLSGSPDFPGLNSALYSALNGNWSGLVWAEFGAEYTQGVFPALPTLCLDQCEYCLIWADWR